MKAALVLFAGVVAVSFASIFIRLAEAPPLIIAAYRLSLASLVIGPVALIRSGQELRVLSRRDLFYLVIAGVFLALHFGLWIASLSYTTVASSVILVTMSPLFVGLFSHLLEMDRVTKGMLGGILLSVVGSVAIGYGDFALGGGALWGDILALGGAVMVTGYLLAGRRLRQGLSLLPYISLTYSVAAAVTVLFCLLTGQRFTGYSSTTYLMFILLALVPQVIGHSAFNWALGYLSAPFVSVTILGEPVGATILAYLILNEVPTFLKVVGGAMILSGIYLASRREQKVVKVMPVK
ncbi:MAG TPA: EamA family transporter [Chloroflexi bacterium]|nr:EamA family transporter [Chloroflexota bacterium]